MGWKLGQQIIDIIRGKNIVNYLKYVSDVEVYSQKLKCEIDVYNKNEKSNILIEKTSVDNGKTAIYFSSNGLYYPMNLINFNKLIKEKNFFEFYKTRYKLASSHIFLRDLRYLWYQYGINEKYNTVEKLACHLKEITLDREVFTFGGSSGGFAAILFGLLINAKYIVVSDPQIDFQLMLQTQYDKNEYAEHYNNQVFKDILKEKLKYANLKPLIEKYKTKIYIISSKNSWVDLPQMKLIENNNNNNNIKFLFNDSNQHGDFGSKIFSNIMDLEEEELDILFSGKIYTSEEDVKDFIKEIKTLVAVER